MMDIAAFFGSALTTIFPDPFVLAFALVVLIAAILILIRAPATVTLMISFLVFAVISGGSFLSGLGTNMETISADFFPVLVLIVLIIGGVIAYAFWRVFGN